MSLLDEYAHDCTILVPIRTEGAEGGWKTEYQDGEKFVAHQALESSTEQNRAEQQGASSNFSGLVDQAVNLQYGDYYRDEVTGITYRVTSKPEEKYTPASASFSLKYYTAERTEPPT